MKMKTVFSLPNPVAFQSDSTIMESTNQYSESSNDLLGKEKSWTSEDLSMEGWSKVFKKKSSEDSKHSKPAISRQLTSPHKTIGRTYSAPVNIPPRKRGPKTTQEKKQVYRVNSSTGPGLSPGGTHRITYDREFLLECRQSPLSLTPPSGLPIIPGATAPARRHHRRNLEKTDSNISTSSVASTLSNSSEGDHILK